MPGFRKVNSAAQVAKHSRRKIGKGCLSGVMPGVLRLEGELGLNPKTVESALRLLEGKGLLV